MKHVEPCLSARDDRESSFDRCGGLVRLVQACLCPGNTLYHRVNLGGGALKQVVACLSARDDRESSVEVL